MARGVPFDEANLVLGPPEGLTEKDVYRLAVLRLEGKVISCWEFTDEEVAEIVRTKRVWRQDWGATISPTYMTAFKAEVVPVANLDSIIQAVKEMPAMPVRVELGVVAYDFLVGVMRSNHGLLYDPEATEAAMKGEWPKTFTGLELVKVETMPPELAEVVFSDGRREPMDLTTP